MKKINIPNAFARIDAPWSPHVAARLNGQDVRLVRLEGSFDWHAHAEADEGFYVVRGAFVMRFRDGDRRWDVPMAEGDFIVVPAGVEHMPHADADCHVMLFEPAGVINTGDVVTARTRRDLPDL